MPRNEMPSKQVLRSMEKKLAKVRGTFILPPDADTVDRTKYEICRQIVLFMHNKGITQRALGKKIGIPETRVSEIVHYRIEKFTVDRLLTYLEILNPRLTVRVA